MAAERDDADGRSTDGIVGSPRRLKVALVVSGGVSLGSFSAGALAEIARQLHTNLDRERYSRAEIDVLVGASAGGIALAVLLRALANPEGHTADGALESVARRSHDGWVRGVDMSVLLPTPGARVPSVLDGRALHDLSRRFLTWEGGAAPCPVLLAPRVLAAIALLNYEGLRLEMPAGPATGGGAATLHRDHRVFCLEFGDGGDAEPEGLTGWLRYTRDDLRAPEPWEEIARTVWAGASFPLAFTPVTLERRREEFGALWPNDLGERRVFTCGDGGALGYEPLRTASRLVALQDRDEAPGTFDRLVLFVAPAQPPSPDCIGLDVAAAPGTPQDVECGDRLLRDVGRWAIAVQAYTPSEELVENDKLRRRLRWRSELRALLAETFGEPTADQAARSEARLEDVLAEKRRVALAPSPGLTVDAELRRVCREQEGVERAPESLAPRERALYTLFALADQVAQLRAKQESVVALVGPHSYRAPGTTEAREIALAGDFLANFGGFLNERYRAHDFQAGCAAAASTLASHGFAGGLPFPVLADPAARPECAPWPGPHPSAIAERAGVARLLRRAADILAFVAARALPLPGVAGLARSMLPWWLSRRCLRAGDAVPRTAPLPPAGAPAWRFAPPLAGSEADPGS
jgi:hypothetical protein